MALLGSGIESEWTKPNVRDLIQWEAVTEPFRRIKPRSQAVAQNLLRRIYERDLDSPMVVSIPAAAAPGRTPINGRLVPTNKQNVAQAKSPGAGAGPENELKYARIAFQLP